MSCLLPTLICRIHKPEIAPAVVYLCRIGRACQSQWRRSCCRSLQGEDTDGDGRRARILSILIWWILMRDGTKDAVLKYNYHVCVKTQDLDDAGAINVNGCTDAMGTNPPRAIAGFTGWYWCVVADRQSNICHVARRRVHILPLRKTKTAISTAPLCRQCACV